MSQTVILTPVRPIVYSKYYSEREYQRWGKRHQARFALRRRHAMVSNASKVARHGNCPKRYAKDNPAPQQNRPRRDSNEEISVIEFNHLAVEQTLRNALIHFDVDASNTCYNRLDRAVAKRMKAKVNENSHHCKFAGNCYGTVKLAWYQKNCSVANDDIFHVVSGRDYDAEIFVPLIQTTSYGSSNSGAISSSPVSTLASSPDSVECGFPTFVEESREDRRKRLDREERDRIAAEAAKARDRARMERRLEERRAEYAARGQSGTSPARRHPSALTAGYGHRHS